MGRHMEKGGTTARSAGPWWGAVARLSLMALVWSVHPASAIVGGQLARPRDWRALGRYHAPHGEHCTATLVGPRVIVTAAHCVTDRARPGMIEFGGEWVLAQMVVSPDYLDPFVDGLDLAVGILDQTPKRVTPIPIVAAKAPPRVGEVVRLLGFGCCTLDRQGEGELRIATTEVWKISDHYFEIGDPFTPRAEGVSLCAGDSGGPTLITRPEGLQVAGVHSQATAQACLAREARLDTPAAREFLASVTRDHAVSICGLDADCAPFADPERTRVRAPSTLR